MKKTIPYRSFTLNMLGVVCFLLLTACAKQPPVPGQLFTVADDLRVPFSRQHSSWAAVIAQEREQPTFISGGFAPHIKPQGKLSAGAVAEWHSLYATLQNKPFLEQAKGVNLFFNRWPFKDDIDLWGKEEYWATPQEFLTRGGDCEDYVAAKYFALRSLGVAAENLRIVIVYDRRKGEYHALLAVYENSIPYILDNKNDGFVPSAYLSRYTLQYSMNEDFFWTHMHKSQAPL